MDRVYLETSFFSACVSTRDTVRTKGWRESSLDWWTRRRADSLLYVSREVVNELSDPTFRHGRLALAMLAGLELLEITNEVFSLAELFVKHKAMPEPARSGDAIHVAVAAVYGMDYLLSWNVKHLANPAKRTHVATICLRAGVKCPDIITPDML